MKFSRKYLYLILIIPVVFAGIGYLSFLYIVPPVLNSNKMIQKYERVLTQKLNVPVSIRGLKIKTHPNLSFEASADVISAQNNKNEQLIEIKKAFYSSKKFSLEPKRIDINYIFADYSKLKDILKTPEKQSDSTFNTDKFPLINIENIYIKLDNQNSYLSFNGIKSELIEGNIICKFFGKLKIPYTQSPVIIGKDGYISYSKTLKFNNLSVSLDNSKLFFSGTISNLNIKGKDLPAGEIKQSFLYFYKLKHPGKKNFIENFHNLSGMLDVNLNLKHGNLNGICYAKNLNALFFDYKIPINLPITAFHFSGRTILAHSKGTFGPEPVSTAFHLSGLASKDLRVKGIVSSVLTNNFSKEYFPPVKISGKAKAVVRYDTHQGNVNINYFLDVDKGNNIITQYGNLDNTDRHRRITASTLKQGPKLYLKNYEYSFIDNQKLLLSGDGLFEKIHGHFKPTYFSVKTNGEVPFSLIQSFIQNYIQNGTFSSDLKYVFATKTLTGFLNLHNVSHKDFLYLENVSLKADKQIKLNAIGTFFNSPITIDILGQNTLDNTILINGINIHLKKFIVKRGKLQSIKTEFHQNNKKRQSSKKDLINKITIEKGKIKVDEIYNRKFQLYNVEIYGHLKNDIVDFVIPGTDYANGLLSAKGQYNVRNHSSNIHFFASDIDSNEVVTNIFNLANQVQGSAYATLHLKTKNKLNDIWAHSTFAISDGFLPQLGSKEFLINNKSKKFKFLKSFKFTLSKITNIDFSNHAALASDITGSFILHNDDVNNLKVFSQSDYLSMLIEGDYNIDSGLACLCIWGRHNKTAERKIKIFKIPLSILYKLFFRVERTKSLYQDKIDQIPPIKIGRAEIESLFKVLIDGNLSTGKDLKIILKDLR